MEELEKNSGSGGGGVAVRESEYGKFPVEGLAEGMRKFFAKLRPEIDLAHKHRVWLAVENHGDALLSTLDSMRLFRTLNPAPDAVGIALASAFARSSTALRRA
jgi:hypothetical protein